MTKIPGLNASATEDGRIYCHRLERYVAQANDKDGYKLCRLDRKSYRVHRLVAKAFYGDSKLLVNHKNGVKYDNRVENLEWATPSENVIHALKSGLYSMDALQQTNEERKRFIDDEINDIRDSYGTTDNYSTLAKRYNVSRGVIYQIIKKSTYKEVIPND